MCFYKTPKYTYFLLYLVYGFTKRSVKKKRNDNG